MKLVVVAGDEGMAEVVKLGDKVMIFYGELVIMKLIGM